MGDDQDDDKFQADVQCGNDVDVEDNGNIFGDGDCYIGCAVFIEDNQGPFRKKDDYSIETEEYKNEYESVDDENVVPDFSDDYQFTDGDLEVFLQTIEMIILIMRIICVLIFLTMTNITMGRLMMMALK